MNHAGQRHRRQPCATARYLAAMALLAAVVVCAFGAEPSATRQKTEMFHSDPRWDEKNNRLEGDKAVGALLNRFDAFNLQWANSKWCQVYFDDLTYTVSLA